MSRRNLDNTTATLPIVTTRGNQKPVGEFIAYIRERVEATTRNWREIAQAFADAKEMYGADSDTFKELCLKAKFAKSTAYRLAAIATNERLKKHETELAAVHSWSTLHAVTLLDDAQFADLLEKHSGDFITESMVAALRKAPAAKKDSWRVFATIYVDENAMKGQLFDGDHVEDLCGRLSRAQSEIPYLKVIESHAEEKVESVFQARVQAEAKCVMRSKLNKAISVYARTAKMPPLNEKGKPKSSTAREEWVIKTLFGSRAEMMAGFEVNPQEVFQQIDGDLYDPARIWDEAVKNVNKLRNKFAEKLRFGEGQFAEANTALAKSETKSLAFDGSSKSDVTILTTQNEPQSEVPATPAIIEATSPTLFAIAAD